MTSASRGAVPLYAALLESCSSTKNLQSLKRIHARTVRAGISSHDFIRAKLVSAYASCAQMRQANILFSYASRQSSFLFNTLIRAYCSLNLFSHSLSVFRKMMDAQKTVDCHTLPSVLKSCAGLRALRFGRQVHGFVLANGFAVDLANSNALISMYMKCGDLVSAKKLFDGMPEKNEVSWSAMMSGYGMHGEVGEVFILFERMLFAGEKPDALTITTVLAACTRLGLVEKGRECFEMMERKFGIRPRLEHYTCMVDMLGKDGLVEEAAKLILGMEVEPDDALWKVFLSACRNCGREDLAKRLREKVSGRRVIM